MNSIKNILLSLTVIMLISSCHKELINSDPDGYYTDTRDSAEYPYAKIGEQTWMMRNMAYETAQGSYIYKNDEQFLADYGRLYIFDEAVRVCPAGWHLPSDKEWKTLEVFLGMDIHAADSVDWRHSGEVGIALKNSAGWYSGGNGNNVSRFSALPGGFRTVNGEFFVFGDVATYWSSTYSSESHAWGRAMVYYETGVYRWRYDKLEAYSVRCLMD